MKSAKGWGAAMVLCGALVACTSDPDLSPSTSESTAATSSSVPSSVEPTVIAPTVTTPSDPIPVVQTGMVTGPGVTDVDITLGVLVDPAADQGFAQGLALWQQTVNAAGGICERVVQLASAGSDDVPSELTAAYRELAPRVLGFTTLPSPHQAVDLSADLSLDQIPALTPSGLSTDLFARSPLVIGPTDDVLAINALSYLLQTADVAPEAEVGVLVDDSAASQNALLGVNWEASRQGVTVQLAAASAGVPADWANLSAVLVLASPSVTAAAARTLPASTVIMTLDSGYDPAVTSAAEAARILVTTSTPAFTSDHPGAVSVAGAFAAANLADPGPLTFEGYATGAGWQRILENACAGNSLTRAGVEAAAAAVGPAPIDSLLGASDPAQAALHLPASRSAAVSQADPSAPGGLTPITGLESADGIAEYVPNR